MMVLPLFTLLKARLPDALKWHKFYPASELLVVKPGDKVFNQFVSFVRTTDNKTIVAYLPARLTVMIRKPDAVGYSVRWFDPAKTSYSKGTGSYKRNLLTVTSSSGSDMVMILEENVQADIKMPNRRTIIKGKTQ